MADYVTVGPARTWYDRRGDGAPLVLLHGGLVDARWFEPNLDALAERFTVYTPDLRGHGHTADVDGPLTFQAFTDDMITFLEQVVDGPADVLGHSMGAFVWLQVALQRPDLVNRLVLISGGFSKEGEAVPDAPWDVDLLEQFLGPAYAEISPDGAEHFRVVATKVGELAQREPHLPVGEVAKVPHRTLLMLADDDIVTLPHLVQMYGAMPNAELAVVPGTSHFLTQEKPELVNALVLDFLTKDPVPTVAPVRRAPVAG
ncbi:alpha/beta fold hydrolase [Jiangella alkaliphila]|uniref:Pimeloyl-ACP methyl ester carboxylesterase n=1 Tax=Jiangella alkaliphila TaxID=419479 RepID=A0A1H2FVQ8_9ACTN|nr:alpha/beta hydrolase [Jiangella alkaliphila]SDU11350.1 Pimeloyl-ACP methyl ester carboxylesterase [Jiangella alkaliphila]